MKSAIASFLLGFILSGGGAALGGVLSYGWDNFWLAVRRWRRKSSGDVTLLDLVRRADERQGRAIWEPRTNLPPMPPQLADQVIDAELPGPSVMAQPS